MSTKIEILNKLPSLMEKVAHIDGIEITEGTDLLEDEVLDSLDWSVFLLEVEKEFNVTISDDDIEELNLQSVKSLVNYIEKNQ